MKLISSIISVLLILMFYLDFNSERVAKSILRYDFINKAEQTNPGVYCYDSTTYNSNYSKVKIICKKHHIMIETSPMNIVGKSGVLVCPECIKLFKNKRRNR